MTIYNIISGRKELRRLPSNLVQHNKNQFKTSITIYISPKFSLLEYLGTIQWSNF